MRAPDPGAKLAELHSRPLVKVCGLTRQEDVDVAVEAGADLVGFILAQESPRRTDALLDAPDTVLRVAVFVGETHEIGADLVQLYEREDGHRARDGILTSGGERVATVVDLPWERGRPRASRPRPRDRGTRDARRRPRPRRTCARRSTTSGRGPSTPLVRPSASPESRITRPCARGQRPRDDPHLRRIRRPLRPRDADPGARRARGGLARGARGRLVPRSSCTSCSRRTRAGRRRLPARPGSRPASALYLKREDLLHTGAHKLNNALGQAVLARRLGKKRIVAETGAGQHGVATATVCARFGLECVVYMGAEDMRRQAPNVERMHLLGAEVRPVEFGTKTLKEATSEAIRDWITNVETTHYLIGSCVGPAPYPEIVRDLQRVIGDEAREQMLAVEGRLPEVVVACVGGGSNAIGAFYAASSRTTSGSSASRPRARRASARAAPASSTARAPRSSPTTTARSPTRTRSRPASTTRASAPSTRPSATPAAPSTCRAPTRRRSPPSTASPRPRDHPGARELARARARARPRRGAGARLPLGPRRQGSRRGAVALIVHAWPRPARVRSLAPSSSRPTERSVVSRANAVSISIVIDGVECDERPKTLAIYLVCEPETPELAEAAVEGGADLSSSASRSPTRSPRARRSGSPSERALARGMRTRQCLECLAETRAPRRRAARADDLRGDPRGLRLRALRRRRRAAGATSAIVVDLPVEDHPEVPRVQLVAPTSTDERIAPARPSDRRLALPRLAHRHDRRARRGLPRARRRSSSAPARVTACRSTPASASRRPSRPRPPPSWPTASSSAPRAVQSPRRARRAARLRRSLREAIDAAATGGVTSAVVVGAGVFGAATARELGRRGFDVTLVEQYGPGNVRSGSGGDTRLLRFSHGEEDWYTLSARRSLDLWLELEAEAGRAPLRAGRRRVVRERRRRLHDPRARRRCGGSASRASG